MTTARLIRPGTVRELAKKLLLAKADEGDGVNPRGRAVFWVGAGASISAGLPSGRALAGRLAQRIAVKLGHVPGHVDDDGTSAHEEAFAALQRAGEFPADQTLGTAYGELFARLDATQQRDFIRRVIVRTNRRQINWAHLAIGELVRQRIVHTLLTTNFDDLLLDGLVRCDQLPAIVDGVESLNRMDPRPPVPQLVYLHGSQHTYSPRNSTEAVLGTRDLAQAQGGLFGLLQQCSALTVVGYAGNPGEGVMEMLVRACACLPELPVYWVSYGQQDSLSEATKELLSQGSCKWLIAGQDADLFFRELLAEMRIGVPVWFQAPVDHLLHLAERISVGSTAESAVLRDEVNDFRERLRELQPVWLNVGFENRERRELRQLMLSDGYREVWLRLRDRQLDKVELLQMRADAAYELGRQGLEDSLPQAVKDWRTALAHLEARSPAWALAQKRLGDALATLGEHGDEQATRDSIQAYGQALGVRTRERMPVDWASTRNNQGLALLTLGEWGDTRALLESLDAFRDALEVYRKDAMPAEWAATKSNVANALQILGLAGDTQRLDEAVATYTEALEIQTRERMPMDWAMTTCNRASALLALGQRGNERALRDAVREFDQAAHVFTRDVSPTSWATIKNNQGAALLALAQRGDEQALKSAIAVFREALEVRARKAMAADWATTSNNLGNALLALGMRGDDEALREAMDILSTAMELLGGEEYPAQHRLDIESLAQRVFEELWRVASREAALIPGMHPPRAADTTPRPPRRERAGSRVLVVEDNAVQQLVIQAMLEKCICHAEIRMAADGVSALELIASFKPDLLILDLGLPGISGHEVLKELKRTNPRLPVLVYSADIQGMSQLRDQQQSGLGHPVTILPKDADQEDFKRLVPTLFKRRQGDRAGTAADRQVASTC